MEGTIYQDLPVKLKYMELNHFFMFIIWPQCLLMAFDISEALSCLEEGFYETKLTIYFYYKFKAFTKINLENI